MKELAKWQIISFISRGIATAIGILQGFIIVRLLSVSEYGIVQIAASIGGVAGIYQHLGLASGSTREISAAKDDTEVFTVFVTATVIKYLVTVPLAVGLFLLADRLALQTYNEAALVFPIKIYSVVLMLQGVQSIFNSVISGTKRFKHLFLYQAVIAVVSLFLFVPFSYVYHVKGYFLALALFNLVSSIVLGFIALKPLKAKMLMPNKADFKKLFKELISISLAIYAVKIIYTWWEKSGPLILGTEISKEAVGIFAFGMLYSKKLMAISDAVTDVSLPVLSEKYVKDFVNFRELFSDNYNKLFVFITFVGMCVIYWAREVIQVLVGSHKYDLAFPLILPLVFAFVFYSFINIIKSSVIIPAKMIKEMITSFAILLAVTVGFYFVSHDRFGSLMAMSLAMFFGSFLSFLAMGALSKLKLRFPIITHDHILLLIQAGVIAYVGFINNILLKGLVFIFALGLFWWSVLITRFVRKEDLVYGFSKFREIIKR